MEGTLILLDYVSVEVSERDTSGAVQRQLKKNKGLKKSLHKIKMYGSSV